MTVTPRPFTAEQILARDQDSLLPVYARYQVVMASGQGMYLTDVNGRRYLDLVAGLGVQALGHSHPRIAAVLAEQAGTLIHTSHLYSTRYPGELAERLCALSGMHAVFYSTGGAEAVEGALKLARSVACRGFQASKSVVVALQSSYHGRTYGALSVTGQERYRSGFATPVHDTRFVSRNNIAELRAAMADDVCAILIEPTMGEGGVYECSTEYLAEARRLANAHHALLLFDEIQCGLGRLGRWFAFEEHGVRPDVLIVGKPLGGGLPLSAILVSSALASGFGIGRHGSTLGGGPLVCRLGLEFLAVVEEEGLLDRVQHSGAYLRRGLLALAEECELATEARGHGLLQGLELKVPARPVAEAALEQGVLLNIVQGNVLRFLPPFLIERAQIDRALDVLGRLLHQAAQEPASQAARNGIEPGSSRSQALTREREWPLSPRLISGQRR